MTTKDSNHYLLIRDSSIYCISVFLDIASVHIPILLLTLQLLLLGGLGLLLSIFVIRLVIFLRHVLGNDIRRNEKDA